MASHVIRLPNAQQLHDEFARLLAATWMLEACLNGRSVHEVGLKNILLHATAKKKDIQQPAANTWIF